MIKQTYNARRRGAALVFVAVSIVTLLVMASLAVDVGYICALTAEQQNTADAVALACASGLQDADADEAHARAMEFLELNQKPQGFLSLNDQIIEYGWWDSVNLVFHPDSENRFACRVRAARNNAPLFFAALMGHLETDVWRDAVAIGTKPCGGIWGLAGVRVPGNVTTDSYDSTAGSYEEDSANSHGDICSFRDVQVMGSTEINGDIMAGLSYEVDTRGGPDITGLTSSTLEEMNPPTIEWGDIATNNDNSLIGLTDGGRYPISSGSLRVGAQDNLTMAPGRYYFKDITVGAQGKITFTGPTTIYMTGSLSASGGGLVNVTQQPGNLTIYSSGSSVKLGGGYEFFGTVVAPSAAVTLSGSADMYGALVGRIVTINGDFSFHVDESLEWSQPWFQPPRPFLVK
jgi:hypothetical protein